MWGFFMNLYMKYEYCLWKTLQRISGLLFAQCSDPTLLYEHPLQSAIALTGKFLKKSQSL